MSCCQSHEEPQYKYEVKTIVQGANGPQETYRYFNSLEEVDHNTKNDQTVSITKVKTQIGLSSLHQQMVKQKRQFVDETFPPNQASLGQIPGNISWRRIPELLKTMSPVLFDTKIEPSDVIAGHTGDCYLLSSLAALAEFPQIIRNIFRGQKENPEGIYKVNLRVDGVVEEIVIDDNIPVQQNGLPIFCQPNKKTGEIWVVLLEKALAKVHGSYANLNEGIPSEIFRTVTYAPSESLFVPQQDPQQIQKVWNILKQYTHNHYPFCATTTENVSSELGLQKSHTYTIISAEDIQGFDGHMRIVKLRNPWKNVDFKGKGSISDSFFWSHLEQCPAKTAITSINNNCDYGLFYMHYDQFCHHFNQIHFCNLNSGGKFISEQLKLGNKASFFDVNVQRDDVFTFELNQSKIFGQTEEQRKEEGIGRSTILLIRKICKQQNSYKYQFVNGIMRYNEVNTILTQKLTKGSYIVYAKIDATAITHKLPSTAVLNFYSKSFSELIPVPRSKYPTLIRDAFLNHAFQNKKNVYCDGNVWLSWQLFYQKGGFAYLAAGNRRESEHAVVINFNEEQFNNLHFKLKKPLKGKGNGQVLRISPGTEDIIIARVINDPTVKTVKFPPKLDIKLEPLYR